MCIVTTKISNVIYFLLSATPRQMWISWELQSQKYQHNGKTSKLLTDKSKCAKLNRWHGPNKHGVDF